MNDSEILGLYNKLYAAARQAGGQRETPHQIAHVSALKELVKASSGGDEAVSSMLESSGTRLPSEDLMAAHQRRLGLAQAWLNQSGRRQRYAHETTFTDIIDAFAAGGSFERQFFEKGVTDINQLAELRLQETEHQITQALEHMGKVDALFEYLMEITGTASAEEMVAKVQRLVQPEPAAVEPETSSEESTDEVATA